MLCSSPSGLTGQITHIWKTSVSPMMGCLRFSDTRILGAVAASQQTFLLSPAPIQANTRGGDQNMQGIGC